MTYLIPNGAFKGRPVTDLDTAFLRVAIERHIQPQEFFDACLAELLARGEPAPAGSTIKPEAFVLPPEQPIRRIPDSLAEIAASAGSRAPPSVSPQATAPAVPPAVVRASESRPSASESIPMPCGHATSDLGWTSEAKVASACMACLNLRAATNAALEGAHDGDPGTIADVIRIVEREARSAGWPHTTSDEWRARLGKADEAA